MDVDDDALGEEAMENALAETDEIMVDMTTYDNPTGEGSMQQTKAKNTVEMNTKDDLTNKEAEAGKKMAQKVANLKRRREAKGDHRDQSRMR